MKHFTLRNVLAALVVATCLGWCLLWWMGARIASLLDRLVGAKAAAATEGKVADIPEFFLHRMSEVLLILTALCACAIAVVFLDRVLRRVPLYSRARGVYLGVLAFCALNIVFHVGQHTAVFWFPYFKGAFIDNHAQYRIKRGMLAESGGAKRVVLLGNSQMRSSVDEKLANRLLGGRFWATELHQSGVGGIDLQLISNDIPSVPVFCAVIYTSETFFYAHPNGLNAVHFMTFAEVPEILRIDGWRTYPDGAMRNGLFGHLVPIFRQNSSISQRVLGGTITNLEQNRFDDSLETDLDLQAVRRAAALGADPATEAQWKGFVNAVARLSSLAEHIVVIEGISYPLIGERRPELVAEMRDRLADLRRTFPKVLLVRHTDLVPVTREDFGDLVHIKPEAQARFTEKFCAWLEENLAPKQPGGF